MEADGRWSAGAVLPRVGCPTKYE